MKRKPQQDPIDLARERMARAVGRLAKTQHELIAMEAQQRRKPNGLRAAQIDCCRLERDMARAVLEELGGYSVEDSQKEEQEGDE